MVGKCKPIYGWTTGAGTPVEGFFKILDCGEEVVIIHWHRDETGKEEATEIIVEGTIKRMRVI